LTLKTGSGTASLQLAAGDILINGPNKPIKFKSGTDEASIYFEGDNANTHQLVIETRDDNDEPIIFRQRGGNGSKDIMKITNGGVEINGKLKLNNWEFETTDTGLNLNPPQGKLLLQTYLDPIINRYGWITVDAKR
jgi:hypothetical protein